MDLKFAYTEAESKVRDALVEAIDKCFDDEPDWWQNSLLPALSENYEIEKTPTEKSIVEMWLNQAYKLLTYRTDGKLDSMHKFTKFYHLDFNRFRYLLTETKLIRNFVSHRSKKTEINMDVESVKMDIGNCKKLTGDVYTLVIFLDDDVSSWDEASRTDFYQKRFFPSVN